MLLQVAVAVPVYRLFDYLPAPDQAPPAPGARVIVPFGPRRRIGIVIGQRVIGPRADASFDPDAVRAIEQVLDEDLINAELLDLLRWAAGYYAAAPGEMISVGLPGALRRTRPVPEPPPRWLEVDPTAATAIPAHARQQKRLAELLSDGARSRSELLASDIRAETLRRALTRRLIRPARPARREPNPGPRLNPDQRAALAEILRHRRRFGALLLAGVTGSGKTEVYLQAARHALRRGRQVLVLLPEIGLTPQFVARLESRLGRTAFVYHSGLAAGDRLNTWRAARDGSAELLIGTRSAVFLPLARPGLLVVDEEHDSSFKQFDGMRYQARDVAVMRASRLRIPIVLGSATPSLESLHNARRGAYRMLKLPERAGRAPLPHWQIDDLRGQPQREGLTPALVEQIGAELERGRQVLVYRNRRGFAAMLQCDECGWTGECTHCSARLTWHRSLGRLRCHHCGRSRPVPPRCPDCGAPGLTGHGTGTERIESALARHFPDTEILRFDRDSVQRRDEFDRRMARVLQENPCIIVGTRMLAKGHHLPGIGLAVMVDADQALFSADFRAPERLAQSVVQVAGRAGREQAGRFILQTRHPDHALLVTLRQGDYLEAAEMLLAERKTTNLPPFTRMVLVRAEAPESDTAATFLRRVAETIASREIEVMGPAEAVLQRRAGHWRQQLWLSCARRAPLAQLLDDLPGRIEALRPHRSIRWHIDVDPLEV